MDKLPKHLLNQHIISRLSAANATALKNATGIKTDPQNMKKKIFGKNGFTQVFKRLHSEVGMVKYIILNTAFHIRSGNTRSLYRFIGFHIKNNTFTKPQISRLIKLYSREYYNNVRRYHFLQFRKYLRKNGAARRYGLTSEQVIALENAFCHNVQKFSSNTGPYPLKKIIDSYRKFLLRPPNEPLFRALWVKPDMPSWTKGDSLDELTNNLATKFMNKKATYNQQLNEVQYGGAHPNLYAKPKNFTNDDYHFSKKYKMPR